MCKLTPAAAVWCFKPFAALTTTELYGLLALRSEVFVVEQHCVFQDLDGTDCQAMHLLGHINGRLVAYARCFAAGVKYPEAAIGRVICRADQRALGLGHQLMRQALAYMAKDWGAQPVRIGAQTRLARFYCAHGFVPTGAAYVEDGIDHIEMLRP